MARTSRNLAAGALIVAAAFAAAPKATRAEPFLGEIRFVALPFAPVGWARCEGQFLRIAEYPDLYRVIGYRFGGDARIVFALPDLRGHAPMHVDPQGERGNEVGERVLHTTEAATGHTNDTLSMPWIATQCIIAVKGKFPEPAPGQ